MQSLIQILLLNAAGALLLAILVWPVGLLCRKPAITRALWIIVLLKLLSPPILALPLERLLPRHAQIIAQPAALIPEIEPASQDPMPPPVALPHRAALPSPAPVSSTTEVMVVLPLVWAAGSGLLLLVGLVRVWALSRILRKAQFGPSAVQRQTGQIALQFGIARTPGVWFVPGVVCPALWAFGRRPRVIIPFTLWCRLDGLQRQTLLAHELAHLRRRDHWARLLEFIATVLYWWHPAVWFARRQIHDCEEQCCDAWVLWAMPASARSYGSALLEAVDFVSTYRPMRPALAAGLGEFRHLKRRLLMIKQGTVSRALSRTSLVAICGAAAFALPLAPSIGQEAAAQPGALPTAPHSASPASAGASDAAGSGNPVEIAQARAAVQMLQAELARTRAQLMQARSRLAVLEHGSAAGPTASGGFGGGGFGGGGGVGDGATVYSGTAGVPAGGISGSAVGVVPPGTGTFAGAGGGIGSRAVGEAIPPGSPMPGIGGGGVGGGGGGFGPRRGDPESRLDGLEQQLKQLMDQVRELKDQQQKTQNQRNTWQPQTPNQGNPGQPPSASLPPAN